MKKNHSTSLNCFPSAHQPRARSRLNDALIAVAHWNESDRNFFIMAFTSRKNHNQLAKEMHLSVHEYLEKRSQLVRRFIHAAKIKQPEAAVTN